MIIWGVLYSRSSNGALTKREDNRCRRTYRTGEQGLEFKNGAAAYVGGNDANAIIQNVNEGIKLQKGPWATSGAPYK